MYKFLITSILSLSVSNLFGAKSITNHCAALLLKQEGCFDCGVVAFANSLPWLRPNIGRWQMQLLHEYVVASHASLKYRGLRVRELAGIIDSLYETIGIETSIEEMSQPPSEAVGLLLLLPDLELSSGHYVTLLNKQLVEDTLYEISFIDPRDPLVIHTRRVRIIPNGNGELNTPYSKFKNVFHSLILFS